MAKSVKSRAPRALKKLIPSDILAMDGKQDDIFLVTKQETAAIVREFIRNEIENIDTEFIDTQRREIEFRAGVRLKEIEKDTEAFISHRFDVLAEKICDMLIQRKFNEEVERRVEERLKKVKKGSF